MRNDLPLKDYTTFSKIQLINTEPASWESYSSSSKIDRKAFLNQNNVNKNNAINKILYLENIT
jgi:Cu2+-containing amine oxidase